MVSIFWEVIEANACDSTRIEWGNGIAPYTITMVTRSSTHDSLFTTLATSQQADTMDWKVPQTSFLGKEFWFKVEDQVGVNYSSPVVFYGGSDQNGKLYCSAIDTSSSTTVNSAPLPTSVTGNNTINYVPFSNDTYSGNGTTEDYPTPSDGPTATDGTVTNKRLAGIVVGTIFGVAVAAFTLWWLRRRRRRRQQQFAGPRLEDPFNEAEAQHSSAVTAFSPGTSATSSAPHSAFASAKTIGNPFDGPASGDNSPTEPFGEAMSLPVSATATMLPTHGQTEAELAEKHATLATLAAHDSTVSAGLAEKYATLAVLAANDSASSSGSRNPSGLLPFGHPHLRTALSAVPHSTSSPTAPAPVTRRPAPPPPPPLVIPTLLAPSHAIDAGRITELPPMYDPAWKDEADPSPGGSGSGRA